MLVPRVGRSYELVFEKPNLWDSAHPILRCTTTSGFPSGGFGQGEAELCGIPSSQKLNRQNQRMIGDRDHRICPVNAGHALALEPVQDAAHQCQAKYQPEQGSRPGICK